MEPISFISALTWHLKLSLILDKQTHASSRRDSAQ